MLSQQGDGSQLHILRSHEGEIQTIAYLKYAIVTKHCSMAPVMLTFPYVRYVKVRKCPFI